MRRRTVWTLSTLVLLALLVSTAAANEIVQLRHLVYVGAGAAHEEFIRQKAEEFERLNPNVKIDISRVAGGTAYLEAIVVASLAGVPYDVVEPSTVEYAALAHKGLLADLSGYLDKSGVRALFPPEFLRPYQMGDKLFGMPQSLAAVTTVSNVTLLRTAGVQTPGELGDGWNWAKMLEIGPKLSVDKDGDGTNDTWAFLIGATLHRLFPAFIHNAGGDVFDAHINPRNSTFASDPGVEKGLEFWLQLHERGFITNNTRTFGTQRTAAISLHHGPWWIGEADLMAEPFDYEVALYPAGPAAQGTEMQVNGYNVSAISDKKDLAWEWIQFLTCDYDNAIDYMAKTGRPSAYLPALPEFSRLFPGKPRSIQVFLDVLQLPDTRIRVVTPIYNDVYQKFNAEIQSEVMTFKEPLTSFLQRIDEYAQRLLDELWSAEE